MQDYLTCIVYSRIFAKLLENNYESVLIEPIVALGQIIFLKPILMKWVEKNNERFYP
ncbi:MAG: hypothetical protein RLZZ292_2650 [Bacteroidota bacterium]|jgi:hypothetical protein